MAVRGPDAGTHVRGALEAAIIRGGTSRGVFLRVPELPVDPVLRNNAILRAFRGELGVLSDGLGGANPVLRKVALVGRRPSPNSGDVWLDYQFGQIDEALSSVSHQNECGNIAAGVPLFGFLQGWSPDPEPGNVTFIRLSNSGKTIRAEWLEGRDLGGRLRLWFLDPVPDGWMAALPMGEPTSVVLDPSGREVRFSVVEVLNTFLFIDGSDLGIVDPLSPEAVEPEALARVTHVSREVSLRLWGDASLPTKVLVVGSRRDGRPGLRVRTVYPWEGRLHPAIAVTGASALTLAANCEGTIVRDRAAVEGGHITITHPSGEIGVPFKVGQEGLPTEVGIERSCRLIMRGQLY